MPSINCKTELKLKWARYVLAASGNDNTNANDNDIIFTNKYTKLFVHVVICQLKTIKNYLNFFVREWNDQCIGMI